MKLKKITNYIMSICFISILLVVALLSIQKCQTVNAEVVTLPKFYNEVTTPTEVAKIQQDQFLKQVQVYSFINLYGSNTVAGYYNRNTWLVRDTSDRLYLCHMDRNSNMRTFMDWGIKTTDVKEFQIPYSDPGVMAMAASLVLNNGKVIVISEKATACGYLTDRITGQVISNISGYLGFSGNSNTQYFVDTNYNLRVCSTSSKFELTKDTYQSWNEESFAIDRARFAAKIEAMPHSTIPTSTTSGAINITQQIIEQSTILTSSTTADLLNSVSLVIDSAANQTVLDSCQTNLSIINSNLSKLPEGTEKTAMTSQYNNLVTKFETIQQYYNTMLTNAINLVATAEETSTKADIIKAYRYVKRLPDSMQKNILLDRLGILSIP